MEPAEIQLLIATAAFVGTHLAMSHPLRAPIVARTGEALFLLLYSLVSVAALLWVVLAARAVPAGTPWWIAPQWGWTLGSVVMLVASVMLAGSFVGNPAVPDPTHRVAVPERAAGVFAITRHPLLWSIILWGIVHIAVLGSFRTVTIGSGMILLSLIGAIGQDGKKARLMGTPWQEWQRKTAFVPFAGQLAGRIGWSAALPSWGVLLGGLAVWLFATFLHPYAGGPSVGPWTLVP